MQLALNTRNSATKNILFVSHKERRCGVYQYGRNIADALRKSKKYSFIYAECSGIKEFLSIVDSVMPAAIIYNYYPSTLSWLKRKSIRKIKVPQIGIIHEVTQQAADSADGSFFQYHIAPDPTLLLKNPIVYKTGRLVPKYLNIYDLPEIPTIGSFGFGTAGKGFERLISTVQKEFDEAIIRLHIPFAAFGDSDGSEARAIAQRCKELIAKPGIELLLSHDFLSQEQLLDFLAKNSINVFFYEENKGRGISSVIDYALAVQRPIAITKSNMFRHIYSTCPSICVESAKLREIMGNGFEPLLQNCREWSEENLIWDYERIVGKVLSMKRLSAPIQFVNRLKKTLRGFETERIKEFWTPAINEVDVRIPTVKSGRYSVSCIPDVISFNRILDKAAREQYKPVINDLFDILPEMMAHKIPEANIQQAFVLDSVLKFAFHSASPRILCVGSYEDTAAAALKKLGYKMDEVDPVLNYDLGTFMHKPSTIKGSYDIIFSTSVIEHVENDELFLTEIVELLAQGGSAILTCDYNDQYNPGDRIPQEDFRLYTQKDFKERLLPLLKDCSLVDVPQWDCPNPDFTYAGCRYTFATLVFRKNKA
jgi:SAM-dependent methyltransferase